ncbi:MAG: pseudaminic acid synthase [Omnitrophica WOR_2 bacterium RIFCSPLOWO2_12_FULL_63_16]|nr:MAG: pseudaminic acid synthase [Omnitrophica WOR_2 bacterium RIFCSPLOWO2_12_FULL_63_16]
MARQREGSHLTINGREIGPGHPAYIVAELSANHGGKFERAVKIIEAAKAAGADAVKLQTYTPDTMTIDCDRGPFQIQGTIWNGRKFYELYGEAHTPWAWHPKLQRVAKGLGLELFSTPFDASAVAFLEGLQVPMYKIASFENVDLPLLRCVAQTGKPIIVSTGLATFEEIQEAVRTIREAGGGHVALLKCTSAYPARPGDMHLRTIPDMAEAFGVPVGLSDHTLEPTVPLAAVALGACLIEKHLTLSRSTPTPDSEFSLEPQEFTAMVRSIRALEQALGTVTYGPSPVESKSLAFRRSLFVVKDVGAGERLTVDNVRAIRPGSGLHTRHLEEVLGRRAAKPISRGTPLSWDLVEQARP